jgi:hypothetical protein
MELAFGSLYHFVMLQNRSVLKNILKEKHIRN